MGLVTCRLNRASRWGSCIPLSNASAPADINPFGARLLHPVVERGAEAGTLVGMGSTDQATSRAASVAASAKLFEDACAVIPGGVNSPVRAFTAVGRHPAVHHRGARLLAHRRRRQPLRRPGLLVGPDDPGSRASGRRRGRHQGRRQRLVVRRADAGREPAGHRDHRPGGARRADPAGELRHRGHHERGAAGPRIHRPRQDRQVLRLLPRPCRRAARRRGFRGGDAGPAVLARGHRRHRSRHNCVALQRHRRVSGRRSPGSATRSPR